MKIDLSRLDQEPLNFAEDLELTDDELEDSVVSGVMRVHLQGEVRPHRGGYLLSGSISCSGNLLCSRCLEPVPWQSREELDLEYRDMAGISREEEVGLSEEELDVAFLEAPLIDLQDLAVEQVMLAMPMRVVCEESCAGLCPTCGGNRNIEDGCSCEPEIDPRWQALRDLNGPST